MNLKDEVVVVTGASRGIGRAISVAFAGEGARIALAARSKAELEETERQVTAAGGRCLVVPTDLNCLSAIQFAVEVLRVGHIIVCGHYGCGGVLAALRDQKLGLIDNWLRHVQDVQSKHRTQLAGLPSEAQRHDRLCELNVIEQVVNVSQTTVVREAWARGQTLAVHGWIYKLTDGLLRDLGMCVTAEVELARCHEAALAQAAAEPGAAPDPAA